MTLLLFYCFLTSLSLAHGASTIHISPTQPPTGLSFCLSVLGCFSSFSWIALIYQPLILSQQEAYSSCAPSVYCSILPPTFSFYTNHQSSPTSNAVIITLCCIRTNIKRIPSSAWWQSWIGISLCPPYQL